MPIPIQVLQEALTHSLLSCSFIFPLAFTFPQKLSFRFEHTMKGPIPLLAVAGLATSVSSAPVLALARGLLDSVSGPMDAAAPVVASDISSVLALCT